MKNAGDKTKKDLEKRLQLAKKTAIKSELSSLTGKSYLAFLSHTCRSPINGIMGMLRLLRDTDLDIQQKEYVESAWTSSNSLLEQIKNVSLFAAEDLGILEIDNTGFDLYQAGREVFNLLAYKASEKDINLEYLFPEGNQRFVVGDVVRIKQVLANLVDNAIHCTEKGHVCIEISTRKLRGKKVNVTFKVSDTSPGMCSRNLKNIFDFTDKSVHKTPEATQTSLELAVCRHIIDQMGGELKLESIRGKGNKYCFNVSCSIDKDVEKKKTISSNVKQKKKVQHIYKGIKALLAEDDPINTSLAIAFLNKFGIKVDTAEDGKEVVKMFKKSAYDIVFMDCEMPEMDGYDATRAIRKCKKRGGGVPIIAMTAYAMRGDRERCLEAGMDDYIPKPITIEVLEKVIKKYLIPDSL